MMDTQQHERSKASLLFRTLWHSSWQIGFMDVQYRRTGGRHSCTLRGCAIRWWRKTSRHANLRTVEELLLSKMGTFTTLHHSPILPSSRTYSCTSVHCTANLIWTNGKLVSFLNHLVSSTRQPSSVPYHKPAQSQRTRQKRQHGV